MLLDITEQAFGCEWYYTDTLKERNDSTRFAKGLVTQTSTNHLVDSSQARSIMDSPALASKDKAVAVKTVWFECINTKRRSNHNKKGALNN